MGSSPSVWVNLMSSGMHTNAKVPGTSSLSIIARHAVQRVLRMLIVTARLSHVTVTMVRLSCVCLVRTTGSAAALDWPRGRQSARDIPARQYHAPALVHRQQEVQQQQQHLGFSQLCACRLATSRHPSDGTPQHRW